MKSALRIVALALALFLAWGVPLAGQAVTGSLRGVIEDPAGARVEGAEVVLRSDRTGFARRTVSGATGSYALASLPAGRYELTVSREGFQRLVQQAVLVAVGEPVRLDVRLRLGEQSEEITVEGELPLVQTDSATAGMVIPNNYVADLPLNGRNFLDLALLAPGVTPRAFGSAGSARGRLAFQANGGRESANAFILDGVYAMDPVLNSFTLLPSADAIQEFRMQTGNSEAGFGRQGGGQVAIILKRGSNGYHGTVYEFLRNDKLDARNFFDDPAAPAPKLRRNQYGFSLGGPIVRNQAFFFADYEGLRERRGITRTTNVPTMAERSGDFSSSAKSPINPFTQQPFPNGQLPFANPVGQAVANLYPLPNRAAAGQNFVAAPTQIDDSDKFDIRADQRIGRDGSLTGRYSFGDRELFEPFAASGFSEVPGFGNDVAERGQNLMIGETHTIASAWLNEFRFGYNRVSTGVFQQNIGRNVNQEVGLPDFATRERDLGLSFITVTGFSPLGDEFNNPQDGVVDSYQILDTVSYARGDHLFQAGFEQRWMSQDAFRDVQARGLINFTDFAFTQNALADLLLGFPTFTGGATGDNPQALRSRTTSVFAQESWRVHSDLTLTLGVRYEYNQPPHDAFDAAAVFDASTLSIVPVGTGAVPRAGYDADRNNFAPRLGIAWSPFADRTTVLRAGYGVYHNLSPLAPGQGIYFNPPFFSFQLFFPSQTSPISIDNPWPAEQQAPVPPSAFSYDRALRTGYAQQWNFTLQSQLTEEVVWELGYHGTKGTKLLGARDINQPAPSPQMPNLRPLPFFLDINQIESSFSSTYHSLQGQVQCRLRDGLVAQLSYTWAKSIDNASNFFPSAADANFPQDSNNVAAERSLSSFDLRHRFSTSFAYEIPVGEGHRLWSGAEGWRKALVTGWKLNGIMSLQTGQPLTVALPGQLDNSNTGVSLLGFGAGDRPNLLRNPELANPDAQLWFDPAAFSFPAFGTFGSAGRNIVSGPPLRNLNFSVLKDATLTEGARLQFRAEFFNLFNTPQFHAPNIFFGTPGFGRVLSAQPAREIQFGIKLLF